MIAAGVAHMIVGACWKITESDATTLFEKFGLDTVAVSFAGVVTPPAGYAGTLTVKVAESLALAAMIVFRVQVDVLKVQIQAPVVSVSAVAVRPGGKVRVRTAVLSIGAVVLVFVTSIVNWMPVSF